MFGMMAVNLQKCNLVKSDGIMDRQDWSVYVSTSCSAQCVQRERETLFWTEVYRFCCVRSFSILKLWVLALYLLKYTIHFIHRFCIKKKITGRTESACAYEAFSSDTQTERHTLTALSLLNDRDLTRHFWKSKNLRDEVSKPFKNGPFHADQWPSLIPLRDHQILDF